MFSVVTTIPDSLNIHTISEETHQLINQGRFDELVSKFFTWGIDFSIKLIIALVIFFVGKWIIGRIKIISDKIFTKRLIDNTLKGFLSSILNIFLYLVLFIIIINVVGTKAFSIAAIIGSAGLAIGLAVKDNLANFAGGVMLLLNKPFKSGDYIEAQNLAGTVQSIGILYTTLTTPDNKIINIPNGPLSTGSITNISAHPIRRVSLTIGVEHGCDIEVIKTLLLEIANAHPLVHKSPDPFCRMTNIGEHSVEFTLRVWTNNSDFWTVTHDLNEEIYKQINEKGFIFPYNQLTIHLPKENK